MLIADKITLVKALVGNDSQATTELVTIYLADAEDAILNRVYPFGDVTDERTLPTKYERLQCKLAARYFLRRGAEGENSHSENGISRGYSSINDEDLLAEVMQVVSLT